MKNYFIGFILVLISLFSFSNKASASNSNLEYNFYTEEYNKNIINFFKEYDVDIVSQLNDLISYYESNLDEEFLVYFKFVNNYLEINIFIIDDVSKFQDYRFYNYSRSKDMLLIFTFDPYNTNNNKRIFKSINGIENFNKDNIDNIFNNLKDDLNLWINDKTWDNYNYFYGSWRYGDYNFIDYNNLNNNSNLLIYSSFDLLYDNYSYGNKDYININTNDNFTLKSGSSLKEFINSYSILNKKENPLEFRQQFNNNVHPYLDKITFDFASAEFTEGTINVQSKISVSNYSDIYDKVPILENVSFKGYYQSGPGGGSTYEYDLNDYISYELEEVDNLPYKDYVFKFKLLKDLPHEYMRIVVTYDFETFDNDYVFDLYDNCTWGVTLYDYITSFLNGYKKYTFPSGYDLAIIRSKNFTDLESYFVSGKLNFEYALYDYKFFNYDFINKKFYFTDFNYEDYLVNEDYFKLPLKIDETNNIFPVIFNSSEDVESIFYLKDDLFVQFINSDTLDSYLDNVTNEDFDDNNDLEIDDSFSTDVDINVDNSNVDFHDSFTFSLDYFKDSIKSIFVDISYLFNNLPGSLKYFYILIFGIILFIFLIRFIL